MSFETKHLGALEYLRASCLTVPHGFTTRLGGVSRGHLASLNIGTHRGDDPENVLKNYQILGSALGADPEKFVLSHQVHGDTVLAVDGRHAGAGLYGPPLPACDALITATPGLCLVVFTADCTPILLHDPVTGAVGAVHAGWRGTAAAIAEKAVAAMAACYGTRPEDLEAAIGPNIGPCCFTTHADVPEALIGALGETAAPFIRPSGEKFHVDLKKINEQVLRRAGVKTVDLSADCTACQSGRFWSHRVTQGLRGSQGGAIVCREGRL